MTTIPPLFISHGSPMTALEPGLAGAFLRALGPAIDAAFMRPRAILALSAHTLRREPMLLAAARHDTVHDFGGFPDALYRLRYDSPGAPELAQRVAQLLRGAGLPVDVSADGGLDHGIWSPLRFAYPEADVPVLPLGFPPDWTPQQLFALGQALAPLTDEGVLVMGTGSITHNLGLIFGNGRPPLDGPEIAPSAAFRQWFAKHSAAADWPALLDYRAQAPNALLMHPSDEHLLPFYGAAGAAAAPAGAAPPTRLQPGASTAPVGLRLHASLTYGCLGMDAYAFGTAAARLAQALGASPAQSPAGS